MFASKVQHFIFPANCVSDNEIFAQTNGSGLHLEEPKKVHFTIVKLVCVHLNSHTSAGCPPESDKSIPPHPVERHLNGPLRIEILGSSSFASFRQIQRSL